MKMRVSDYIADFISKNGIKHVFTVTGGGAMFLNDSLGHNKGLKCVYNHHEQACAIAAEGYARINNELALVCVTTGPGGTNAITGVVGGWLDSIPMLVISGQVRYDTTARYSGLDVRAFGDQEFDITKAVSCMTKYSEMVTEPKKIKYCLEKALTMCKNGRPGPCWLDIPLNVQGAYIETEELESYDKNEYLETLPSKVETSILEDIIARIKNAKRPVIYAGSAIRTSGAYNDFIKLIEKLNIPVVLAWNSIDTIPTDHPLYAGRGGIMGDRPGNFAVQNSDLMISLGCRLSIRQTGYNYQTWARDAYKVVIDVDAAELEKHTINADMKIHANVKDIIEQLNEMLPDNKVFNKTDWIEQCSNWVQKYPIFTDKHKEQKELVNIYHLINELSNQLKQDDITVVGNGSACVVGSQGHVIKKDSRFIINSGAASMGYDLPAAIGAYFASNKRIICVTGDGSIQMNLQELQTMIHHKMPIKLFLINNGGYHSIRQTQKNYFGYPLVGVGEDSEDLSFPDMKKIAEAYGFNFERCDKSESLSKMIQNALNSDGSYILEVMVDKEQLFEPKASSKKLEDGTIVSMPLEDLAPFLCEDELKSNMYIPLVHESKKLCKK